MNMCQLDGENDWPRVRVARRWLVRELIKKPRGHVKLTHHNGERESET